MHLRCACVSVCNLLVGGGFEYLNHSFNVVRSQEKECLHSSPLCLCSLRSEGTTRVVRSAPSLEAALRALALKGSASC